MIVISSDAKSIVDARGFQVTRNIGGGKDGKYVIVALGEFGLGQIILSHYPDEKTAIDELEKIYNSFAGGASAYRIS